MVIFGKRTTPLRGDHELWLELEEKFSNYDSTLPPEKFKDALYRTFNEIIAKGKKVDEKTIFFEDYNPKGISGGHVHLPWCISRFKAKLSRLWKTNPGWLG